MPVETKNIRFISAFVRRVDELGQDSNAYARIMQDNLYSAVLNRVEQSIFVSGIFKDKPYSDNPIKAYKLGSAKVTGKGMGKELTINGIVINQDDWYWGEWDREKKGIPPPSGGSHIFGDSTPKPVPVFVPGYRAWRVEYNGLSGTVDLDFTGSMLNNFEVELTQARGANQYGNKWNFDFEVYPDNDNKGFYTDIFRGWLQVTTEEIETAFGEVSDKIVNTLFSKY